MENWKYCIFIKWDNEQVNNLPIASLLRAVAGRGVQLACSAEGPELLSSYPPMPVLVLLLQVAATSGAAQEPLGLGQLRLAVWLRSKGFPNPSQCKSFSPVKKLFFLKE